MQIELTVLGVIDILSIATALMLGFLFFTTRIRNNRANIFLGLFLWSLMIEIVESFLQSHLESPFILPFSTAFITLPLLFFYIIQTIGRKIRPYHLVLFTPCLLSIFLKNIPLSVYLILNSLLLFYMLKILMEHQRNVGDFYSNIENKTLSWLKAIVYVYIFFHAFWIIEEWIELYHENIAMYFAEISVVLTFLMIYWIGHNGFSQREIFTQISSTNKKNPTPPLIENTVIPFVSEPQVITTTQADTVSIKEYKQEKDEEEETEILFKKLSQKIRHEKLFLQEEITIRSLSKQLQMNEKKLSKLIKKHTQKNFYHYINQFRVEEFKKLLHSPSAQQMSLLGLALEAGFHSKSTFYTAFKNKEGMTPKQYQDQLKKSD